MDREVTLGPDFLKIPQSQYKQIYLSDIFKKNIHLIVKYIEIIKKLSKVLQHMIKTIVRKQKIFTL